MLPNSTLNALPERSSSIKIRRNRQYGIKFDGSTAFSPSFHPCQRKWLLAFLILGLFAVNSVVNAKDEIKQTEKKTVQPSPASPSLVSTLSSSIVAPKDEIYIDDEGIEGSGGRGEIHDDLDKDSDYSGSGFGPDDEDSSTDRETHHHRQPSIHTQSGNTNTFDINNSNNDLITSRTNHHQTNSGTIIGSGTQSGSNSNTDISGSGSSVNSNSGNTDINTIDNTNTNNNKSQFPAQSFPRFPVHTNDDDDDDEDRAGHDDFGLIGGSGDGDNDDDDDGDDDDELNYDEDEDEDLIGPAGGSSSSSSSPSSSTTSTTTNKNDDLSSSIETNIHKEKPMWSTENEGHGGISKFDDIDEHPNGEDEEDADNDSESESDNDGDELFTDVTVPYGGSIDTDSIAGTTSRLPGVNNQNQGNINELGTNTINSLQPDQNKITEHTTGNEVLIMNASDDDRTTSFFAQPGILAAVIGGAVVGLLCAILVVMFIVYRMRKKDEGSYALDEPKRSPAMNSYAKNANNREFYA